jgi:REP element-mobilizing transposase RayT
VLVFGSKFRARKRSCQSFELKLFNPHHFHVLIVTIYRTFVLLNTLICPVGTLLLSIAKSLELKILVPKGKSDRSFVFALNEQWRTRSQDYAALKEVLDTPFTQASEREQGWLRYRAWLQKRVEEPMFLEAFSLKQVYVPLRAYYERQVERQPEQKLELGITEGKEYERVVVDLNSELETWLQEAKPDDAIRLISGGPGSGKSSFAKIFAAQQAEKGEIPVLLIPLHLFTPSDDLVKAVGEFVQTEGFLRHNPMDRVTVKNDC